MGPFTLRVCVALLLFAITGSARAQGFALDRFDPSERGSTWFTNESLDFRGKVRPAAGVVFEGQYRPLAIYNGDGSVRAEIVRHSIMLHPGASVVFFERVRLGLSVPVALYQDGVAGTLQGMTYPPPGSPSVGDLRIGLDGRIVGDYDRPFRLAVGARLFVPSGTPGDYDSDGRVRVEPRLMAAGDIDAFTYSARFGFQYRDLSGAFADGKIGSEVNFAAAIGLRVLDKRLSFGPEIFGSTVVTESSAAFSRRSTPLELMGGVHYTVPTAAGDIRFGGGAGAGLTRGFGAPVVRYLFDLEWAWGVPAEQTIVPEPVPPTEPEPKPLPPPPPPDKDGDGILDADDACPDVSGVASDDPKKNGCPPDKDGDGVYDVDDACPDVSGMPSPEKRFNGCPPDMDNDGIPNSIDACPDVPGKPDPDPKKNGCPKAFVSGTVIKILDQVKFKTASAEILPGKDSQEILDAVQKVLKDHPEIKQVQVEGHTDNKGAADYNRTLSAARAASVVKWLAAHGIEKARLSSQGFGMEKPIDTNDTEEGRRNNRRVEFHIVEGNKP